MTECNLKGMIVDLMLDASSIVIFCFSLFVGFLVFLYVVSSCLNYSTTKCNVEASSSHSSPFIFGVFYCWLSPFIFGVFCCWLCLKSDPLP